LAHVDSDCDTVALPLSWYEPDADHEAAPLPLDDGLLDVDALDQLLADDPDWFAGPLPLYQAFEDDPADAQPLPVSVVAPPDPATSAEVE
jgi:hypothetical protein